MTAARQKRKRLRAGFAVSFAALAGVLMALLAGPPAAIATTTERLVVDWHTGLAIGGYDPVAIGRGRGVQGHPLIWAVAGQRLYLFYSEQTRASFLADPGRIFDTAERKWPDVRNLGQ